MNIQIKGKEQEVKFTFNSFKYMENLDMGSIAEMQDKPFKMIPILTMMLLGGLNHNPKERFSLVDVDEFLSEYVEREDSLPDLLEELMALLEESHFFKALQKSKNVEVPQE